MGLPFADWLALREPADAAARSSEQLARVLSGWSGAGGTVHDLGSGTGSMARWLAPRLPGPQHWVLYDRDAGLLERAAAGMTGVRAADGAPVTVRTRPRDITRLGDELAGADLVTASALLDMLSADELERTIEASRPAGPVWFTLSVLGRVALEPADPLDAQVAAAFDEHQRRSLGGRTLAGPDAVRVAADCFERQGRAVHLADSPWRLGAGQSALAAEWFTGWLAAAREQRPELVPVTEEYAGRRLARAAAGRLGIVVGHADILATHE